MKNNKIFLCLVFLGLSFGDDGVVLVTMSSPDSGYYLNAVKVEASRYE